MGMIDGFVPTNTMACGHILEMLLRKPVFMAHAQAAASADDDALLKRCLFEAMRFKPLNPGPFRSCAETTLLPRVLRAQLWFVAGRECWSAPSQPCLTSARSTSHTISIRTAAKQLHAVRSRAALVRRCIHCRSPDYPDDEATAIKERPSPGSWHRGATGIARRLSRAPFR